MAKTCTCLHTALIIIDFVSLLLLFFNYIIHFTELACCLLNYIAIVMII